MKLILSILFAAFAASAQVPQETVNNWMLMAVPRGATCSTYNTTNAWDNFIEGFQIATTGYESNVWTGVGTTANISPAYNASSLTTYKPDGACSQALRVVAPSDGTETYARADLGAGNIIDVNTVQTDLTVSFYVETAPDAGEGYGIFSAGAASAGSGTYLLIRNSSGQLQARITAASNTTYTNISTGQWYTAFISLDTAAASGGSTFKLFSNGSQITSETFQRSTTSEDIRYVAAGFNVALDANDSGTVLFDLICIKTN